MPRFHFNVYDGHDTIDKDGSELLDDPEARREAIRLSGAILEETGDRLQLGEEWCMEVTDEAGSLLFRLDFTVVEGPGGKTRSRAAGLALNRAAAPFMLSDRLSFVRDTPYPERYRTVIVDTNMAVDA